MIRSPISVGPRRAVWLAPWCLGLMSAVCSGGNTYAQQLDAKPETEPLGKRIIEGIEAEGTRSILTIPAGQIGNEQPIQIVSERWYSSELETVILSKHSDPRFAETMGVYVPSAADNAIAHGGGK